MTINDVANHLDLDWKTVKNIDKYFLEQEYGETDYSNLRILAIDEVSIRKGHNYLTVVLNYETGRVVWIGEGRKKKTLDKFFSSMTKEQREKIEAIALDMWKPFINCIRYWCPKAEIVFDLFHVVSEFNRVIDRVRNIEYRKANKEEKGVIKGSKFLLLTNKENLKPEKRPHLKELLEINKNLSTVYILKDLLKRIWRYRYPAWAKKALHNWYELAYESNIVPVIAFADRLRRHEEGILNHCSYPIATGIVEGTNNKIKVIQRNAYGFHDIRYFILKVKQAFP
jgi:transposase